MSGDCSGIPNSIKLWVDDIREPPDRDWVWAPTIDEATLALESREVVEASLDTGRPPAEALVQWMCERGLWPQRQITVHAPAGRFDQLARLIVECGPFEPLTGDAFRRNQIHSG